MTDTRLIVLALLVLFAGCSDDTISSVDTASQTSLDPPATSAPEPILPAAEPTTGQAGGEDNGLSYDEAEALGVLTGTYDALALGPSDVAAASVRFELVNVGESPDFYEISIDDGQAGSRFVVIPTTLDLEPEGRADVTIELIDGTMDGVELVVVSRGRGDEVIRLPLLD